MAGERAVCFSDYELSVLFNSAIMCVRSYLSARARVCVRVCVCVCACTCACLRACIFADTVYITCVGETEIKERRKRKGEKKERKPDRENLTAGVNFITQG